MQEYQHCQLKRHGSHTDLCTVSRCRTRGESKDHTSEKAHKGSTLALKPREDVIRNPHEKDLCPSKIYKRKYK